MMFDIMEMAFPVLFFLVFGFIIFILAMGIRQWSRNNHSPVLTVEAIVVGKRDGHSDFHVGGTDGAMTHHSSTSYYATFEVESGDRMELCVSGEEYGMLAQGDMGRLTFQGTRFMGFQR